MKKFFKKRNDSKMALLSIFFFITIIAMVIITIMLENEKGEIQDMSDEIISLEIQKQKSEEQKKTEDGVIVSKLMNMKERDRIEFYFSRFIEAIESESYEKAYEMLYEDYKDTYFPTLNEFKVYSEKTFPYMMSVEHTNFERNGDVYILFVTIFDSLTPSEGKDMKFVIKENSYNDFTMSFSVV